MDIQTGDQELTGALDEPNFTGRLLGENHRYCLQQYLGGGGMGNVYVAIDTSLNQTVAVKLLKASLLAEPELLQRFERECAICAALKSPHIVQIRDYGVTADGYPFYVMEYLQGQPLSQLLESQIRLSVEQACTIAIQICAGLQVAHAGIMLWNPEAGSDLWTNVIHRDLKPDNIFLVPTALGDLVKIIDFGVAKLRSIQQMAASTTDMFLGTRHYAAPEQLELSQDLDAQADIYSLGVILYEMLTGSDPFGFDFRHREVPERLWLTAHLSQTPLPFCAHPSGDQIPPDLEAIVMRCLAKAPQDRYASVSQLSQALREIVEAAPQVAPQAPQIAPVLSSASLPHSEHTPTYSRLYTLLTAAMLLTCLGAIGAAIVTGISVSEFPSQSEQLSPAPSPSLSQLSLARTLAGHADSVWALTVSQDGQTLVSGSQDQTIKVWNLPTGRPTQILTGHQDAVRALSLSSDGQMLFSGGADQTVKLWNIPTGTLQSTLSHTAPVWSVALNRSEDKLVSGSGDGKINLWNPKTEDLIQTIEGHDGIVYATAFNPLDETGLASSGADRTVKLWNTKTGDLIRVLSDHTDAVRCLAFSSQGMLASGSWDKTIKLWDTQTGQLIRTLTGHDDRVTAIAFNGDGTLLVSASVDQTIKLWHVQTGKLLQSVSGHSDWVLSVAIDAQAPALISGSKDKTIKIWQ